MTRQPDDIGELAERGQRSFQISRRTVDHLDAMARATGGSRTALAERLPVMPLLSSSTIP